jgi:hypothetical protein
MKIHFITFYLVLEIQSEAISILSDDPVEGRCLEILEQVNKGILLQVGAFPSNTVVFSVFSTQGSDLDGGGKVLQQNSHTF